MSSIVYSFHWVRRSRDEKKQRHLESPESIPTASVIPLKTHSFVWFNQLFPCEINNNQTDYPQFDFEFLHSILLYLMAAPYFLIIFICLITLPTTNSYNILQRTFNKLDNQRLLYSRTLFHSTTERNDCIPLQAVRQLNCPFIARDHLYHQLFESVCDEHRLCYACGHTQGITEEKCDKLSLRHMYELCSKNSSSTSDCLTTRFSILTLLQQDIYRSSEFSFECSNKCLHHYLYSSFHLE